MNDEQRVIVRHSSFVSDTRAMRQDFIDSLIIGGTIALIVLAIHALADGAAGQLQLLALAGFVLFCIQLTLTIYRTRRSSPPPADQAPPPRRLARLRRDRSDPFVRELTHDWTGLDDHIAERDAAKLEPHDEQAGDLMREKAAVDEKLRK